ncbi:hypothetical protein VUR80DRAFT_3178 [Thermomyces stellatus]
MAVCRKDGTGTWMYVHRPCTPYMYGEWIQKTHSVLPLGRSIQCTATEEPRRQHGPTRFPGNSRHSSWPQTPVDARRRSHPLHPTFALQRQHHPFSCEAVYEGSEGSKPGRNRFIPTLLTPMTRLAQTKCFLPVVELHLMAPRLSMWGNLPRGRDVTGDEI